MAAKGLAEGVVVGALEAAGKDFFTKYLLLPS